MIFSPYPASGSRRNERGNVLFMILIAVALIGLLSAAIMNGGNTDSANIDDESLLIKATEVQSYASELERGVTYIVGQNGKSESDIRFAHPDNNSEYGNLNLDPDPSDQVFHRDGGGASYRLPPSGVNDGSPWEFYGGTAIPGAGSNRAELVAVLPNVTQQFCTLINKVNGQTDTQPLDTGAGAASGGSPGECINIGTLGRFDDSQQFYTTVNTLDVNSFTQVPALQACVQCSGGAYHFYHVLLTR